MKYHSMGTSALLALLISSGLSAQTTTTAPTYETTVTTGMVGWVPGTQTAQLNVLNVNSIVLTGFAVFLDPYASGTTTTACPVELDFIDAQNNVLKSMQVSNVAPGMAASLTLKLSDLTAATTPALRASIRGVVKSNQLISGTINVTSAPVIPATPFSFCSLMPTLELFDSTTGVTQTVISDTRPSGAPVLVTAATNN